MSHSAGGRLDHWASNGSANPNSLTTMSGIVGKSSCVMCLRNRRTPLGAEYSQLILGSAAGPIGNPFGATDVEPAQSGKDGCERLLTQASRPPLTSYARNEE